MKTKVLLLMLVTLSLSINAVAQIKNGDMEKTRNTKWPWNLHVNNAGTETPGAATMSYEAYDALTTGHFLQVVVTAANTEKPWNLRVKQGNVVVGASDIKITFKARGTVGGELLRIKYDGDGKPQADFTLTTTWEEYELVLPATSQGTTGTISLWTKSVGTYQFDDVVLK
ncbi:hypothetical protein [Carboxylicivirga marina]|uniref:CBM-cenC domain-containing protein n=1 Tax=Carboxylicivirga marina TaxID=2800988 RepID=A0ABS1HEI3_9BACT|nr:hypothetical protein [Carboxylicivirga marina]MBK3516085.1 hypothetical protein [Carboxylicivirga marina]